MQITFSSFVTERWRETDRQTDRQTETERDRDKETETVTQRQRQRQRDRETEREKTIRFINEGNRISTKYSTSFFFFFVQPLGKRNKRKSQLNVKSIISSRESKRERSED